MGGWQMSLGEVKAGLKVAIDAARQGRTVFDQAVEDARAATTAALGLLHGSHHSEVEQVRAALAAADREVEPVRRRYDGTADHTDAYLRRIG